MKKHRTIRLNEPVPISAVVLTHNEEANIEAALKSIADWCHEIHLVDSGSTDRTLEIARDYTDKIYVHRYVDHNSQWQWVFDQVPLACEWMLLLDSDFVLTDKLKRQIAEVINHPSSGIDGYYVHHRYVFRGQAIRFGGTKKWWLRLVRHCQAQPDYSELVDFRLHINGRTRYLDGIVFEDNKKEYDIDFWLDKHQKFSTRMAAEEVLRRAGYIVWNVNPTLLGNPDEHIVWLKQRWYFMPLRLRAFLYFAYRYFFRLGFLDGWNGFLFHFLQAFWFRLIVDEKISELQQHLRIGKVTLDSIHESFVHRQR